MHSYLAKQAGVRELSATGAQGQEVGPVIASRRIKQPSGAAHTEPARSGAPCSGAALNQIGARSLCLEERIAVNPISIVASVLAKARRYRNLTRMIDDRDTARGILELI